MKIKGLAVALFTGVVMLLAATGTSAETYYISNDGNDSASGTTIETAWKSLDKFFHRVSARR